MDKKQSEAIAYWYGMFLQDSRRVVKNMEDKNYHCMAINLDLAICCARKMCDIIDGKCVE